MAKEDDATKISGEIFADARNKAERAMKAAQREADGTTQRAREEARQIEQDILAAARRRADSKVKIIQAAAGPERKRLELNEREKVIRGIVDEAKARLLKRDGAEYAKSLVALAAEAAEALGGGQLVAYLAPQDMEKFRAALPEQVRAALKAGGMDAQISVQSAREPIEGGVVVETADGARRVDNSVEARLRRLYPGIRRGIAEILYK
jgi:vacuolar-type H+-ATPase subunit E/Vma4